MTEIVSPHTTYALAGVNIAAGEQAVTALRPHAERARRPEVLGAIGGFAGLFKLKLDRCREPVLASLHRRRRHQDRDSAGAGRAPHHRDRPGGDGG